MAQVALMVFLLMALFSYSRLDPSWTHAAHVERIANWAGRVGAWVADMLLLMLGLSAYWLVVFIARRVISGYRRISTKREAPRCANGSRAAAGSRSSPS